MALQVVMDQRDARVRILSAGRERAERGDGGREGPRASLPPAAAERDLVCFSAGATTS